MRGLLRRIVSYAPARFFELMVGLGGLVLALLAAEAVKHYLALAIPVAVLGVVILVIVFALRGQVPAPVRRISEILLPHMALFFIPVLVVILVLSDLLAQIFWPLIAIIIVSTLLPLWVTAWVFQKWAPPLDPTNEAQHADE